MTCDSRLIEAISFVIAFNLRYISTKRFCDVSKPNLWMDKKPLNLCLCILLVLISEISVLK